MIPSDEDVTEHLLRILPTTDAELIYLESRCTSWSTAVGAYGLGAQALIDGTPLHSVVTGRKCRTDWRTLASPRSGSAWEELSLLRMTTDDAGGENPFAEIADRGLAAEATALPYRH